MAILYCFLNKEVVGGRGETVFWGSVDTLTYPSGVQAPCVHLHSLGSAAGMLGVRPAKLGQPQPCT